jgi:hypothetical protein
MKANKYVAGSSAGALAQKNTQSTHVTSEAISRRIDWNFDGARSLWDDTLATFEKGEVLALEVSVGRHGCHVDEPVADRPLRAARAAEMARPVSKPPTTLTFAAMGDVHVGQAQPSTAAQTARRAKLLDDFTNGNVPKVPILQVGDLTELCDGTQDAAGLAYLQSFRTAGFPYVLQCLGNHDVNISGTDSGARRLRPARSACRR